MLTVQFKHCRALQIILKILKNAYQHLKQASIPKADRLLDNCFKSLREQMDKICTIVVKSSKQYIFLLCVEEAPSCFSAW